MKIPTANLHPRKRRYVDSATIAIFHAAISNASRNKVDDSKQTDSVITRWCCLNNDPCNKGFKLTCSAWSRFVFLIPKAEAPTVDFHVSHPSPLQYLKDTSQSTNLEVL